MQNKLRNKHINKALKNGYNSYNDYNGNQGYIKTVKPISFGAIFKGIIAFIIIAIVAFYLITKFIWGLDNMDTKIVVYKEQRSIIDGKILTRTTNRNEPMPKGCYITENEAINAYNEIQRLKTIDYNKYKVLANDKLDKLEADIKELLLASNCELDFTYEGDSHGIYSESLEISTVINNHTYAKQIRF